MALSGFEPLLDGVPLRQGEPEEPLLDVVHGTLRCAAAPRREAFHAFKRRGWRRCAMWSTGTPNGSTLYVPRRTCAGPTPPRPMWPPNWSGASARWTTTNDQS